jgi:hypothetical protein
MEEVQGFFNRVLPEILKPEFERYIEEYEHLADYIQAASSTVVDQLDPRLGKIVDVFHEAETRSQNHYVVSFCTTDHEWISKNGLLSQWRGYGLDGGYALVFDTQGLDSLLPAESEIYHESSILFAAAQYQMTDFLSIEDEQVRQHIQSVKKWVFAYLTTGKIDEDAIESMSLLSTMCKHRGFEEEKEIRIVVREPSVEMGQDPLNETGKPYREIHSYLRDGATVPCIHLFEGQKLKMLPIRRVIVGPHPDKNKRRKAVEILLHDHGITEVVVSDTPYRGR